MPTSFRFFLSLFVCICATAALGQAPAGYYTPANGLRGAALEAALRNIIDGHTSLSYDGAKDRLWDTVDVESGRVTCVYTGRTSTSLNPDTDGMNAEHTWPQSRGAGSTPPRSDLHHLFVTDAGWNSRRGSLRFTTVTSPTATSPIGAKVNSSVGFEPPDQYKGDVARVIFYFAVRYDRDVRNGAVINGTDSSTSDDHMGEVDDLVDWHFADPPSQREFNRNNRIFAIQGNRNPFIDNPDYVTAWLELGPTAPTIATTTQPTTPDFANATHLRSSITSAVAVNSSTVNASWRVGSAGAFTTIPMTILSGTTTSGTWQTSTAIPVQPGGTRIEYFVNAADTAGTAARDPITGQNMFTVRAAAPPAITVSTIPAQPRFDQVTTFNATITAELGIQTGTPILFYRTGAAGAFTELLMTLQTGTVANGTWQTAPIAALPGGTIVQYYAQATDTAGTTARQPAAGTLSFSVFVPGAPVLNASITPPAPRVGSAITISATVTSTEGIATDGVTATYTTTDGRSGDLPMIRTGGTATNGTWTINPALTGISLGATLSYAVTARDIAGRAARNPDTGFKTATIAAVPTELNIAGYKLTETDSNIVLTFPTNTVIAANGFVIVGRQASKTQFESVWGALPANAVYINAFDVVAGNGMVINGGEIFTLTNAGGTLIDGPTATTSISAQNARNARTATNANTWARSAATAANPGVLEIPGTGAGLIVTEFADPATSFQEAFVEIYHDAPAPPEQSGNLWMVR